MRLRWRAEREETAMMERPANVNGQPGPETEQLERERVPEKDRQKPARDPAAEDSPDIAGEFNTSGTSSEDWAKGKAQGWNIEQIDDQNLL